MPTWLDEGIALQVDHRPRYSSLEKVDNTELKRILSLNSPASFWTEDSDQNVKNYQSSKVVVNTVVMPVIEKKGLYGFLEEIKEGNSVDSIIEN